MDTDKILIVILAFGAVFLILFLIIAIRKEWIKDKTVDNLVNRVTELEKQLNNKPICQHIRKNQGQM